MDLEVENTEVESTEVESTESQQESPQEELKYDGKTGLAEKIEKNPDLLTQSQVAELEKLEKVKYNGKVLSGKELARELKEGSLRLSDYTKKTQAIAEERKYYDNLAVDLKKLKANPALAEQFKSVYPEKYHWVLDILEAKGEQAAQAAVKQEQGQQESKQSSEPSWKEDPEFKETLDFIRAQKLETATTHVNTVFDKMLTKYPHADDSWVAGAVAAEREAFKKANPGVQVPNLDEKSVEALFKKSQEEFEKKAQAWSAQRFQAQKNVSEKVKGPGSGGGVPGAAPKVARNIKEATEFALQDPSF